MPNTFDTDGRTHFDRCYLDPSHHACALASIERLEAQGMRWVRTADELPKYSKPVIIWIPYRKTWDRAELMPSVKSEYYWSGNEADYDKEEIDHWAEITSPTEGE